ncbi:MAG: DUF481 domain-containing protein [Gemmatimonadota bacterium]|nr:DUF481 domain-containing protein [Gemmatimonadota bacterium]
MRTWLTRRGGAASFLLAAALLLVAAAGSPAVAQDGGKKPRRGFFDTADLSVVLTSGNATATTFGLKNLAEYVWPRSTLKLDFGGVRTDSRESDDRRAIGTSTNDFQVLEPETEKTAESYFVKTRFDHRLDSEWFAFVQGSWDRNTFAGFDAKWQGVLGAGWIPVETDDFTLKLDIAATMTREEPVDDPGQDFAGLRVSWTLERALTDVADLSSELVADENISDTEDFRIDWTNAVEVSLSEKVALKTSYRSLWRNQPLFETLPLFTADGVPVTGDAGSQLRVPRELDSLDSVFTTALVVRF